MSKDPAFLFYPQDFFMGTSLMSFEDIGKYIKILCVMHQKGHLSEESIRLLVGSVSVFLKDKFKVDSVGLWYNERLDTEIENRKNFVESRRNNGKLGGRPKNIKPNGKPTGYPIGYPNAEPLGYPTESANEDINKDISLVVNKRKTDVLEYCKVQGYPESEGESFYDHYQALGWQTNAGMGIVDWKAKMRTWHKEQIKRNNNGISNGITKGATVDGLTEIANRRRLREEAERGT